MTTNNAATGGVSSCDSVAPPSGGSSSSGQGKDLFIYELPSSSRVQLCDHLDELNVWNQLATFMNLRPADVQSIRRQQTFGNSPSDELLKIWGGVYNHTVTELFVVLKKQKLFPAMRILKDFVERKYHILIPNSQPALSKLMIPSNNNNQANNAEQHSEKILNRYSTSSGVSNSNNALDTSDNNNTTSDDAYTTSTSNAAGGEDALSARNVKKYASFMLEINYAELTEATQNWSEKFILGKGGFGTVFRGYWKHTDVAIKQIHYRGPDERESVKVQLQQSLNELKYLNSCRHDNVLPLYGYSIKGEKPCLVYQLMAGGSLEERLNSRKMMPLTWQQRGSICLGTARGINYLHTFRESKPLIHGDIKPANVLLDQCLQPKIGDFGLAREGPNAINSAIEVSQVFGTKPYLPPEFLNSRKLSTQVDTYSFGVVLLETFTGLRAYDRKRPQQLLTKHILKLCSTVDCKLEDLIDQRVPLQPGEQEMCRHSIQLGITCIADSPQYRPEMEQVLKSINSFFNVSYNFNQTYF